MLAGLQELNLRKSQLPGKEKMVIVSGFTSTLDAVATLLDARAMAYYRIDGSIAVGKRQTLVNNFNRDIDPREVFLLSCKAGGVGLNLIGGSRLVMMDCDWNPAVDRQAMGRIWRQGQRRPVHIYRIIAADTIDEAILQVFIYINIANSLNRNDFSLIAPTV